MAGRSSPYRVLIVDDSMVVRQGLRWLLEDQAELQVVGEAGDGLEAVQQAIRLQPDVVILDVEMPHLDGYAVARSLKASPSPPLILFLTIHAGPTQRAQGAASGADGYVEKSAGGSALLEALRASLDLAGRQP
jgi:DNA-binding NarL/FixJ family response regulator